ncbi:hypothetical protein [Thermoflexibacter ruber]|uniref:Uncharacterized protein n=1 Tax=Thermoflexibacter ruber TaxID=1003 RepID=A0A1I2DJP5_9BACT|nr:hypothetical protein [Thermoflexibacter ruber]SFE80862.1 hypothetical protein SAMN04488541_100752 [Thermoflexibacter ruber]
MEIQSFEIHFETSDNTPPPYSYAYILKGEIKENLHLHYQIQYTHREDLSLEEIVGEGFSPNDDLELDGAVSKDWAEQVHLLLSKTKPSKYIESDHLNFFEIILKNKDSKEEKIFPHNQEEWEYLCEELSQALLEERQVERPLQIHFKKISPLESIDYYLMIEFSKRQVLLKCKPKKGKGKEISMTWGEGKKFLELIFKPDYLMEDAQVHEPTKHGFYINLGDALWYEGGKTVLNRSNKNDLLAKIEKKLVELSKG